MTTHYYAPPEQIIGNTILLDEEEARHALQVLRAQVGTRMIVVDGVGGWYEAALVRSSKKQAELHIISRRAHVGESGRELRVGLALLKNPDRFETFVEKAVELGVTEIWALQTLRTESQKFRPDRLERIMIAALKQCGRSVKPLLKLKKLPEALTEKEGNRFICHEKAILSNGGVPLMETNPNADTPMTILIGPEGGFSDEEILEAERQGWQVATLGKRRLRAETAALVVASLGIRLG